MDAEAILVLWSRPFMQTLVVTSHESSKSIMALIGQAVSEKMFANNGHGHAYSPEQVKTTPWGQILS